MRSTTANPLGSRRMKGAELRIILDKNVVQGSKAAAVIELCKSGRGVMPDVLFYEMLTTGEPARSRCFAKFPGEDPVTLVPNVGELLQYETTYHKPCGKPTAHRLTFRYRFNPKLAMGNYVLPQEAQKTVAAEDDRLREELERLIEMINSATALFEDCFKGSDREGALQRYRIAIANDPNEIVEFYKHLDAPPGAVPGDRLTNEWIHFRWLQVMLWGTLDLRLRLGEVEANPTGERGHRLENFLFDMQYAMLGLLEGGLATEDAWLRELFKALRPDGVLLPSDQDLAERRGEAGVQSRTLQIPKQSTTLRPPPKKKE